VTQAIGVAALEDRSYHEDCVRRTLDQRARLEHELEALGWTWPESAANFLLCEIGERAERVYNALKDEGLLVRWWRAPELRTKIRISVGNHDENDHLLAALKRLA
jgi:histidinol-phosphate aminotransferase